MDLSAITKVQIQNWIQILRGIVSTLYIYMLKFEDLFLLILLTSLICVYLKQNISKETFEVLFSPYYPISNQINLAFNNYNNNIDDFVIFNEGKGLKRISLTPKVLSASSKILFLVSGASKRIALERLLDEKEPPDRTPSKLIKSINQISIFCDQDSAKELKI